MSSSTTVPVIDSEKAANDATRLSLMRQRIIIQDYLLHTTSVRFSRVKAMRMQHQLKVIDKELECLSCA